MTGKKLIVDINVVKRKFFVSCNCILGKTNTLDDMIKLNLMESYCLPVLTYAIAALALSTVQCDELNACWNSVYRRIFGFNRWESVHQFIYGLGRLDFKHLRLFLHLKFLQTSLASANETYVFISRLYYMSVPFQQLCIDGGLDTSAYNRFASVSVQRIKKAIYCKFANS